ncbi:Hypothetical_protein [Hexamita inflata]|uniref:Hypothetical_protein n=1 Tax=Hexamita inflata TaxID=28002 RepID=A0AA86NJV1_9EUKA|nr:Hypothetical protein HINF_LOCUS9012 [Hexamita inflata]
MMNRRCRKMNQLNFVQLLTKSLEQDLTHLQFSSSNRENYLKKLHKLHLQTNMQLYTQQFEYVKLLESLTVSETYIERLFSYLGRSTENNNRDSLKMKTFESLCYLKVNSTLEEALKKLAMENNEEEV